MNFPKIRANHNIYDAVFLNLLKHNDYEKAFNVLKFTSEKTKNKYQPSLAQLNSLILKKKHLKHKKCDDLSQKIKIQINLFDLKNRLFKNKKSSTEYIKNKFYLCNNPLKQSEILRTSLEALPSNIEINNLYNNFRKPLVKEIEKAYHLLEKNPELSKKIIKNIYPLLMPFDKYYKISRKVLRETR